MVQLAAEPETLPDPPFDDDQVMEMAPGPPAAVPDKLMVEAVEVAGGALTVSVSGVLGGGACVGVGAGFGEGVGVGVVTGAGAPAGKTFVESGLFCAAYSVRTVALS